VVDRLVALAAQVIDEVLLEVDACVVGAEVNSHGRQCSSPDRRPARPRPAGTDSRAT
jgi:hypothetical protein